MTKVRIKTKEEFIKEFGKDWRDIVRHAFTPSMDEYLGNSYEVELDHSDDFSIGAWWFSKDMYIVLDHKKDTDMEEYSSGGMKEVSIDGKPKTMFQLIDPVFIEGIGNVLTMGVLKYAQDNWKKVDRKEYERAIYHHLNEYRKGLVKDEESGESHLYHIACNAMFLDWFDKNK